MGYERSFELPGAPRAMACSRNHQIVGVGARDGSVTLCPPNEPRAGYIVTAEVGSWTGGVRALAEVSHDTARAESWWLVGHLDGTLRWLCIDTRALEAHWEGTPRGEVARWVKTSDGEAPAPVQFLNDVVYVGLLDDTHLMVSCGAVAPASMWSAEPATRGAAGQRWSSQIFRVERAAAPGAAPRLIPTAPLPVRRVCATLLVAPDTWLCLTYTAEVWQLIHAPRGDGGAGRWLAQETPVGWMGSQGESADLSWRPSLVMDAAVIGDADALSPPFEARGIMASTDTGIFLYVPARAAPGADPARAADALELYSSATGGLALGLACFSDDARGHIYAWFSDSSGGAHLYRTQVGALAKNPHWNRLQVRRDHVPAVRALALKTGERVFLWQTCQDQNIRLVEYALTAPPEGRSNKAINELTAAELEDWLEKAYRERPQPPYPEEKDVRLIPAANLADVFDPPRCEAHYLWEFLGDPKPALAIDVLNELIGAEPDQPKQPDIIARSVQLWSHALVGSILRLAPAKLIEDYALGVIRWLHLLRRDASAAFAHVEHGGRLREALAAAASAQSFNVRRWTFYAPSRSDYLPHVARRLARLREEEARVPAEGAVSYYEERVALEATLFVHRVDDEGRCAEDRARGVVFDIATLEGTGPNPRTLTAVLWRSSEIRLFAVQPDDARGASSANEQLEPLGPPLLLAECPLPPGKSDAEPAADTSAREDRASALPNRRFGRALALWRREQRGAEPACLYLLTSLRGSTKDRAEDEYLLLFKYENGSATARPTNVDGQSLSRFIERDEAAQERAGEYTLTSACVLGASRVLLGLRGPLGAHLVIVEVIDDALRAVPSTSHSLRSAYGEPDARLRNPVSALASAATGVQERQFPEQYEVIAGCGDGQVWHVHWSVDRRGNCQPASSAVIGRLSAPVWSVAMNDPAPGEARRVYAGGGDGQLLAWQQLPAKARVADAFSEPRARETPEVPGFVALWATREKGAIVRLTHFKLQERSESKIEPTVLAVSRDGRAVLFTDGPRVVHSRSHGVRPMGRPLVPGQRLERFKLRSTAFAAALIVPQAPGQCARQTSIEAVARLLIVTAEGGVRLLGLHQPKRGSKLRLENYEKLWALCRHAIRGADRRIDPMQLRQAEALRALAPLLYVLPVAKFLPELRFSGRAPQIKPIGLQRLSTRWAPRHFRPYARSVTAYRKVVLEFERESPALDQVRRDLRLLEAELDQALRNAFELHDQRLFAEIMENVLKRFNRVLVQATGPESGLEVVELVAEIYQRLMALLESCCRWWVSVDPITHAKVEIVRVKNFVDGHVLCELTKAASKAAARRAQAFSRIILTRVQHVERLLMSEDSLVQLETLRAVNLSLIRAAWLQREAVHGDSGRPASWPEVEPLLNTLGAFATIAAHNADDTLAHELARSFALCPFVSPQNAETAGFAIHLARMPQQIIDDVRQQVKLLPELLLRTPSESLGAETTRALEAFERVLDKDLSQLAECGKLHAAYAACDQVTAWLDATSNVLESTPGDADFSVLEGLAGAFGPLGKRRKAYFRDDYSFWTDRLEALLDLTKRFDLAVPRGGGDARGSGSGSVPPALVLASSGLATWAADSMLELDRRYKALTVHDPQYTRYRGSLRRFRDLTAKLRASVAVQRQLVTGVLDHDLLERLDEHVFELWDLAHVLDPWAARASLLGNGGAPAGSVERFAQTLTEQMKRAASIPKNLRTLYQLLDARAASGTAQTASNLVKRAFPAVDPVIEGDPVASDDRTASFLKLILDEIAQNHRIHGSPNKRVRAQIAYQALAKGVHVRIGIILPLSEDENISAEQAERLSQLSALGIQDFMPKAQRVTESNGLGLYLANLAAAIVSHRIVVKYPWQQDKSFAEFAVEGTIDQPRLDARAGDS